MKRVLIIAVIACTICRVVLAQPDTLWTRTFGNNSDSEYGHSVCPSIDGTYVVAGYTSYPYGLDALLIKVDNEGNEIWTRYIGDSAYESIYCIQETTDGGYIMTGIRTSSGGQGVYLLKTDTDGIEQWHKTFYHSQVSGGNYVQQTTDGGYIIVGFTGYEISQWEFLSDIYIIKTDSLGNKLWDNTFGETGLDYGKGIVQSADGGYVVVGISNSGTSTDVYLFKTNSIGNAVIWSRTFGGEMPYTGYSIDQTIDGGYIITGSANPDAVEYDVYLLKTDSCGIEIWSNTYDAGGFDIGYCVQETFDSGYIIAGSCEVNGRNCYVIKTDIDGEIQWSEIFGASYWDTANSILQTADGGYIVAGSSALSSSSHGDVYVVRFANDGSIVNELIPYCPSSVVLYPPFPNPFNSTTTITFTINQDAEINLSVYDIQGREVQSLVNAHQSLGTHTLIWDASRQSNGVYFMRLMVDGRQLSVRKVVLLK